MPAKLYSEQSFATSFENHPLYYHQWYYHFYPPSLKCFLTVQCAVMLHQLKQILTNFCYKLDNEWLWVFRVLVSKLVNALLSFPSVLFLSAMRVCMYCYRIWLMCLETKLVVMYYINSLDYRTTFFTCFLFEDCRFIDASVRKLLHFATKLKKKKSFFYFFFFNRNLIF